MAKRNKSDTKADSVNSTVSATQPRQPTTKVDQSDDAAAVGHDINVKATNIEQVNVGSPHPVNKAESSSTQTIELSQKGCLFILRMLMQDLTYVDIELHDERSTTTTLIEAKFCTKFGISKLDKMPAEKMLDGFLYLIETTRRKRAKLASK